MSIIRKSAVAAVLSAALAFNTAAAPVFDAGPMREHEGAASLEKAAAETRHPALQVVQDATERLMDALARDKDELKRNPDHIYTLLEQHILPHFDREAIARMVLARHWRTASDEQKARFTEEFTELLMRTYASALSAFSGETVTFRPVRAGANANTVTIQTQIKTGGGNALSVDYQLYRDANNQWKIYDVAIEGMSLMMTHRSEYNALIQRLGGLDGLIRALTEKNDQLGPVPIDLRSPAP